MSDAAVKAGDVAAKMLDRWAWWRAALTNPNDIGRGLPVHDGDAQQGYYRTRFKKGPWEPVAIFYPESSDELVAYRAGREVRPDDIWTFCCRNPISYEQYQRAIETGSFDDEPPAPPTIGHNSGDLDAFEAIRLELAGETETAGEFLASEITTQAAADRAAVWAKRIADISKRADGERKTEKEPHLQASREVDDKWRDIIEGAKDLASKLKRHMEPFLIAQKRAEDERRRKAEEEARKQREEAEAAARAAMEQAGDQEAAQRAKEAQQRADEAARQAQAKNASAGRTGARVALRTEKRAKVVDYQKAATALLEANHPELREKIDQLAQRAVRAGVPLAGVEVEEISKAA